MREFFKPWRRKAGVVTLGLATLLLAMWVRSRIVGEYLEIPIANAAMVVVVSKPGSIGWFYLRSPKRPMDRCWHVISYPTAGRVENFFERRDLNLGYGPTTAGDFEAFRRLGFNHESIMTVPHGSIVLPLTLLSAYLLLRKPRPVKKRETSTPTEPDNA